MTARGLSRRLHERAAVALSAFATTIALAAGCGGEVKTGRPDVAGADFPGEAAEAMCANIAPCCRAAGLPFDDARCRQNVALVFGDDGLGYSRVKGAIPGSGKCLDALQGNAQTCTSSLGCQDAYSSLSENPGKVGDPCIDTCTRVPGVGAPCNTVVFTSRPEPVKSCYTNDGLYCDEPSGVCQKRLPPGAPCVDAFACEGGLCAGGRCSAGVEGKPCGNVVHVYCGHEFYCTGASSPGRCGSIRPHDEPCYCARLKPDGAACASFFECANGPCENGRCNPPEALTRKDLELTCL